MKKKEKMKECRIILEAVKQMIMEDIMYYINGDRNSEIVLKRRGGIYDYL